MTLETYTGITTLHMQASECQSILYFSRGRGRGHALPDLEIVSSLLDQRSDYVLQFVSYATGAKTLEDAGFAVVDLHLPEEASFLRVLSAAFQVISEYRPSIVISHEEFGVIPAAKLYGLPVIFVSDWLPPTGTVPSEAVALADSIVFIEKPGIFPVPAEVKVKIAYSGPVVRKMSYTVKDRPRARHELGLPDDALVISVFPGAWATEERAPLLGLILAAFDDVRCIARDKLLVWVASSDADSIRCRCRGRNDIVVLCKCSGVEQIMVASNVGITKGNRGSTLDLANLGIPSISISRSLNYIDDLYVARIPSNIALNLSAVDPEGLARHIEWAAALREITPVVENWPVGAKRSGAQNAAAIIASEIGRLIPRV